MHKIEKLSLTVAQIMGKSLQFPHCDQRILHEPGVCQYCDLHPEWQALRVAWGIAFTGWLPDAGELPCPADYTRGDAHKQWVGNVATSAIPTN